MWSSKFVCSSFKFRGHWLLLVGCWKLQAVTSSQMLHIFFLESLYCLQIRHKNIYNYPWHQSLGTAVWRAPLGKFHGGLFLPSLAERVQVPGSEETCGGNETPGSHWKQTFNRLSLPKLNQFHYLHISHSNFHLQKTNHWLEAYIPGPKGTSVFQGWTCTDNIHDPLCQCHSQWDWQHFHTELLRWQAGYEEMYTTSIKVHWNML